MRPLRVTIAMLAWLAVVGVASSLVWVVISRAGDQVVSQEPLVATTQQAYPRAHPGDPTRHSAAPDLERRTWQDFGMLLVAECDRRTIRQVSASPADGYAVEIKDDGPDELEVEFEGREDEEGTHVTVTARCVDGVPDFSSTTEDDD